MKFRSKYKKRRAPQFCKLCKADDLIIDYKDTALLKQYTLGSGKIVPSKITGICNKHQRQLAREIKKARQMALLPTVGS
ncbi:MAG: 30S ribosomal protein S18 [Candidatus Cloacimonadota bacterium]|nr:30S ribosomal protein S18 [Candidatus Cloacimonadota bacterium]